MSVVNVRRDQEGGTHKVISRGVRKENNAKRDRKEYSNYELSYLRILLLFRLLLTILGLK